MIVVKAAAIWLPAVATVRKDIHLFAGTSMLKFEYECSKCCCSLYTSAPAFATVR